MHARALLCLLILAAAATACAKPMTVGDFRSDCRMYYRSTESQRLPDPTCDGPDQDRMCKKYADAISAEFPDRAQCIQACEKARAEAYREDASGRCRDAATNAYFRCDQYCRQNYK